MQKMATLTGHTMRVLYLAVSPDGQTIVTGKEQGAEGGGGGASPTVVCVCAVRLAGATYWLLGDGCWRSFLWGMVATGSFWCTVQGSPAHTTSLSTRPGAAGVCWVGMAPAVRRVQAVWGAGGAAGAGDETLRFWNVFPGPKSQGAGTSESGMGSLMRTLIR